LTHPSEAGEALDYYLGPESPLSQSLNGFAPREGQRDMANSVLEALQLGSSLVVEAGTGTGKTLAYLLPALLSQQRIIISTGTKTLQDQLFHRDLPNVSAALGRPVKIRQLKGRANYLCKHRLDVAAQDPVNLESGVIAGQLRKVERWAGITRSGDVGEVKGVPEDSPVWRMVTSTLDNCLGSQCPLYDECHVLNARQAALGADIVVVNHHLLMADLVLKDEGFGELLPGCEAVIVDEAHQFPEVAQNFFNRSFVAGRVTDLLNDLKAEALAAAILDRRLDQAADAVTYALSDARMLLPSDGSNLGWKDLPEGFLPQMDVLLECLQGIIDWLEGVEVDEALPTPLQRCLERARKQYETLEQLLTTSDKEGLRWAGITRMGFSLNFTPVDVASSLNALQAEQPCTWIYTSATLAVEQDFAHFLRRMGIEDAQTRQIASPFDYPTQTLLYLPENLPPPNQQPYTRAVVEAVKPLIEATEGRCFLLFTSHRALREAANLLDRDPGFNRPLLVQGRSPRSRLLEDFVELDGPVLLGTQSFWEGVDIRGDDLVLVVIDKLPFASPGDPMLQVRLEAIQASGGNPFRDYQLPQAVLNLKQGVGRLIRDVDDWGVVVLCDPRLQSSNYGNTFLASLPEMPRSQDVNQVLAFIGEHKT